MKLEYLILAKTEAEAKKEIESCNSITKKNSKYICSKDILECLKELKPYIAKIKNADIRIQGDISHEGIIKLFETHKGFQY